MSYIRILIQSTRKLLLKQGMHPPVRLIVFAVCLAWLLINPHQYHSFSSQLNQVLIRPSRTQAGVNPGRILVQFATNATTTETGVRLDVGNSWSVANIASWQVTTTDLPSGITAIPGLTVASVSGQQITFTSNDLSSGTNYGFYITSGVGTNPSSAVDTDHLWSVHTLNSDGISQSSDVFVTTTTNDQISITASIRPREDQLPISLTALGYTDGKAYRHNIVTYQLTYGSQLEQATPLQLQVQWDQATLPTGQKTNAFTYIPGSATAGWNGTVPIVNLAQRTLTWNITSFPALTTQQTVSFQVVINEFYNGPQEIPLIVRARVLEPIVSTDTTVQLAYRQTQDLPTSLKSCNQDCVSNQDCQTNFCDPASRTCRLPTNTVSQQCTLTTPSQVNPPAPTISRLSISQILHDSIFIDLDTSAPTKASIWIGTASINLKLHSTTAKEDTLEQLVIDALKPQTVYYFQVRLHSATGQTTSNIYQITTASLPLSLADLTPQLNLTTSLDNLPLATTHTDAELVVPTNTTMYKTLAWPDTYFVTHTWLGFVAQAPILGADSQTSLVTNLPLINKHLFSGSISTPSVAGGYRLVAYITTNTGHQTWIPLEFVTVSPPLTIVNALTKMPVELIPVTLVKQNPTTLTWEKLDLPKQSLRTNAYGQLPIALPIGNYHITVRSPGFITNKLNFSLNHDNNPGYPQLALMPTSRWLSQGFYHLETLMVYWSTFQDTIVSIQLTHRLFGLTSQLLLATVSCGLLVGLFVHQIPTILRRINNHNSTHPANITIFVTNQSQKPLSGVTITLLDPHSHQVMSQTTTNLLGKTRVKLTNKAVEVLCLKPGFMNHYISILPNLTSGDIRIVLTDHKTIRTYLELIKDAAITLLSNLFVTWLCILASLLIVLTPVVGWPQTVMFVIIWCVAMIIWTVNRLTHHHHD